jgi:hypothetical protein
MNDRIAADNSSHQRSYILAAHRQSRPSAAGRHRHPALSRTEEARGSNPLTSTPTSQVRASPASSRRRSPHAAAAPRPHAQVAVQPRRLAATKRLGPGPHTTTTQRSRHLAAHPGSPPTGDPRAHPANPGRPRGRPRHCPTTAYNDGQVQATLRRPNRPAPPSTARFRPGSRRTGRGHRRRPRRPRGHPSHAATCPPPPLHHLPAGHSGRGGRGNPRTPDTGHLSAQTPAPDTGQRPRGQARVLLDTRTRHWTAPCTSSSCSPPRPRSAGPCCCASSPRSGGRSATGCCRWPSPP